MILLQKHSEDTSILQISKDFLLFSGFIREYGKGKLLKFNKLEAYDNFRWKRIVDASLTGVYDMPTLQAVHGVLPRNLVPFHTTKNSHNPSESWFHFYEDDYQFERIWNRPDKYIPILKRFEGGFGTDYSIYLDMPRSQQIWNCWRNRAITYYLQKKGLTIIPNVGWSDSKSLNWAFDGIPEHSILSITTQGCMANYVCKQSLLNGIHELSRQKYPELLVVYGCFPEKWLDKFSMPIYVLPTFSEERWRA